MAEFELSNEKIGEEYNSDMAVYFFESSKDAELLSGIVADYDEVELSILIEEDFF
jgi:hypothetical protein